MTEEKEKGVESNGQEKTEAENSTDEATKDQKSEKSNNTENNEEESELDSAIIRQVEYYFGDVNMPRDKFLKEQIKLDDGWVPLDILIKFNRLASLTTETEKIANAINKSTSGLLEVSDDNKKVRRSPEMPLPEMNEERRKELLGRTIYAKGFAKDANLDDLLKFFKQFEEVENIVMRRYPDKQTKKRLFKGSVFATFKTKEQAEKFIETKDIKYNNTDLLVLWQEKYLQQKQEEYNTRKEKKDKKPKNSDTKEDKDDFKLPTGTVLHFTQSNEKTSREHIKEALTPLGSEVAYIDFQLGNPEGWVRFIKENAAKEIFEKITDGKLKVNESEAVFRLLEGDEEKQYLEKTIEEMSKRRKNMKNFKHNKGKGNFKGKQQRKRRNDNRDEGPPAKVKADN